MNWFALGDRNTKFFHSYVQGRRKKLSLWDIIDEQGLTVNNTQEIGRRAVEFFQA